MKISTLFIIDDVELTESQSKAFRQLFAEWTIVNRKLGRMLISALINDDTFDTAQTALHVYNPVVIGKWDSDGNQIAAVAHLEAYISMLPAKFELVNNQLVQVQRAEAVDVSGWSGWGERLFD
jgi:hypothetical protein